MKKAIILLILLTSCAMDHPQKDNSILTDSIVKIKDSIKPVATLNDQNRTSFYDRNVYTVLDSAVGNLNLDEFQDKILVLKNINEDTVDKTDRPLLVLIGNPDKSFKLAACNDKIVLCKECGGVFGDPYENIEIKNGFFTVGHYGGSAWRWTRIITFMFSKDLNNWILYKDEGISYHNSDPDKVENIQTNPTDFGKLLLTDFDYTK